MINLIKIPSLIIVWATALTACGGGGNDSVAPSTSLHRPRKRRQSRVPHPSRLQTQPLALLQVPIQVRLLAPAPVQRPWPLEVSQSRGMQWAIFLFLPQLKQLTRGPLREPSARAHLRAAPPLLLSLLWPKAESLPLIAEQILSISK